LYHVDGFAEVVLVRERCLKLNAEAEEKVGTVILILKLLLSKILYLRPATRALLDSPMTETAASMAMDSFTLEASAPLKLT